MQRGGYTSTKLHDGGIKHPETTEPGETGAGEARRPHGEVVFRGLMFGTGGRESMKREVA